MRLFNRTLLPKNQLLRVACLSILIAILGSAGINLAWNQAGLRVQSAPVQQGSPQLERGIPAQLRPCLPRDIQRVALVGKVQESKRTYFLLSTFGASESAYWESLIQLDQQGCLALNQRKDVVAVKEAPQGVMPPPLSHYVPQPIARSLLRQRYQQAISRYGGVAKYQQVLDAPDAQTVTYWYSEEVEVLTGLGIRIPKEDVVVTYRKR